MLWREALRTARRLHAMTRGMKHLLALTLVALTSITAHAAPRPKLAIIVVVDQLSADHLNRRIEEGRAPTFKRLLQTGFHFEDARYDAAPALTAPGHASIATGAYPHVHGVIGNDWYDAKLGRFVGCAEDPAFKSVTRDAMPGDGTAPTTMRAGTLGESLKVRYPGAKVVGIAGKDRSAIMLSGRAGDLALWLDRAAPRFTTSTYYAEQLPAWVAPTNEKLQKLIATGFTWSLPHGGFTGANKPQSWARDVYGYGKGFPHRVNEKGTPDLVSAQALHHPAIEALVVDLALAAVAELKLGQDDAPDLLAVSFSSFDKILHAFGPESEEAGQALTVIDAQLKRLIDGLDGRVGKNRYVLVVTADHGGLAVPETLVERRIDAGRVNAPEVCAVLEKAADAALGDAAWFAGWKSTGCHATSTSRPSVHRADEALIAAGEAIEGVRRVMGKPALLADGRVDDQLVRLYRRGLDAERSPDFIIATEPFWMFGPKDAAGHGSWHLYDRHVPLIFAGPAFRRGVGERAESIDVAPTLARVLGCGAPVNATGRVLLEALP